MLEIGCGAWECGHCFVKLFTLLVQSLGRWSLVPDAHLSCQASGVKWCHSSSEESAGAEPWSVPQNKSESTMLPLWLTFIIWDNDIMQFVSRVMWLDWMLFLCGCNIRRHYAIGRDHCQCTSSQLACQVRATVSHGSFQFYFQGKAISKVPSWIKHEFLVLISEFSPLILLYLLPLHFAHLGHCTFELPHKNRGTTHYFVTILKNSIASNLFIYQGSSNIPYIWVTPRRSSEGCDGFTGCALANHNQQCWTQIPKCKSGKWLALSHWNAS